MPTVAKLAKDPESCVVSDVSNLYLWVIPCGVVCVFGAISP